MKGAVIVKGLLPRSRCLSIGNACIEAVKQGKTSRIDSYGYPDASALDEGGLYRYDKVDKKLLNELAPELIDWYLNYLLPLAGTITEQDVIQSPYDNGLTAVVYSQTGDMQEWHGDSNPITCLPYFTDAQFSGSTDAFLFRDGGYTSFYGMAGDVLFMQGRYIRHRAAPVLESEPKVVAPLNIYTKQDQWRPEHFDKADYWHKRETQ